MLKNFIKKIKKIMKISFTKMLAVIAAILVLGAQAFAQNVIWTENFGAGAIPATWTNVDAAGQLTTVWEYSTAGPYFGSQPAFSAPTASNGFAIFNSDAAGNVSHDVRLTTDAINCSALTTVIAKFSNQYAYYSTGNVSIAELGVSTNGTTFTYFPILEGIAANDLSISETVEEVDITSVAAGQTTVYLQFRWRGFYEYAWRIDDIKVQDGVTPLPPDNVGIASGFYAIAPSYQMPVDQVDTIRFLADVANVGSNAQTNVTLTVNVVKNSNSTSVHTQSYNYGTLQPGDTIENYLFPQVFVPAAIQESYTATYTLTSDATDSNPADNTATFDFEVSDGIFGKVAVPTSSIAPGGNNSWTAGTHYYVFNGTEISGLDTTARYATAITFGISNAIGTQAIAGQSVDLFLEKGYDVNENGLIEASERTVVAFGSHTFVAADDDIIIAVPIDNFSGLTPLYELEDNEHYLVTVRYAPSNATSNMFLLMSDADNYSAANFAAGLNGVIRYDHLLDIGNSTDYNHITNFSGNPTPAIGLITSTVFTTSSADIKLEDNALAVFPNPADDFITATINLTQTAKNATITIYNIQGQIVETRTLGNVSKEQVRFDVSNYTSGTYMISIDTEFGHTIKRFVKK